MRRRSLLALPALLATPALAQGGSQAPAWRPNAPVRYVIGFPPGSSFDMVGRIVAEGAAPLLGQTVVVENRPGAGTLVAVQAVKTMPADGQTVLMVANSFTVNQSLHKPQPYSAVTDFDPLALLVYTPHVLVCHPSLATDFAGFMAKAKAEGRGLSFGTNGQGTSQHMGLEHLKMLAGLNAEHIPYRGVAPMLTDLLAGRVDYSIGNLSDVLPAVRDNRLVPLGIVADARHPLLPAVPTLTELGFPQLLSDTWYGVVLPAGAPEPVKAALSSAFLQSIGRPEARERLAAVGLDVLARGPADLRDRIQRDTTTYAEIIRVANLTAG